MRVFKFACLLLVSYDAAVVSAYSQHRPPTTSTSTTKTQGNSNDVVERRGFFAKVAVTAVIAVSAGPESATATEGVISSKFCAYGEGNDCEDLAEGNPYILELQKRSAANKQNNVESAKNAFYAKNYPDWFAAVGKTMIQKESDGTFIVVDDAELAKLRADGKITVKVPSAMGGRVTDVTQKPTLVLKE
eukprot:jgi/Psemu1/301507/fgenesh1_kg.36_\